MRLLLDEMYPALIAARLREAGYDVTAITEERDLVGADDDAVCDHALAKRSAVVTENAADFLRILRHRSANDQPAPSLIVTANRSFPRHSASFVGRAVRALGAFCDEHADDDPLAGAVHWLKPVR